MNKRGEPASAGADLFKKQLAHYKSLIDEDIAAYSDHVRTQTSKQFGTYPGIVTDAYLDLLNRPGKRLRGALVMVGYEMCGGRDEAMIARAATAIEMLHTYILTIDDIQDRSLLRRGEPTVHELLAAYHRHNGFVGDSAHAGVSLALNAALAGGHAAQVLLAGLSVDPQLRLNVIGIVNHTMIVTAHGQTADITNELDPRITSEDIEHALEWKTAHYTFLNPLCVGMVLAGADCKDTDAIRDYALHAGKAFQITDDMLGIFGDEATAGKSNLDDIREGKRTLLVASALERATKKDREFLLAMLGNSQLTREQFKQCQQIIRSSRALEHVRAEAKTHIRQATAALDAAPKHWHAGNVAFLRTLAEYLIARQS